MSLTGEAKKEYQRDYMKRKRSNKAGGSNAENVRPVAPYPSDGWPDVMAYILREGPRMANLERLQRIAGSLGKQAGEVWFGISGLTMEDIGEVIGTQEALCGR
jgi:hypothetical protein